MMNLLAYKNFKNCSNYDEVTSLWNWTWNFGTKQEVLKTIQFFLET